MFRSSWHRLSFGHSAQSTLSRKWETYFQRSYRSKPLHKPSQVYTTFQSLKWTRRLSYVAIGGTGIWYSDKKYNASALGRNVNTLITCMIIALDYKLNFSPEKAEDIPALHERVANRIYDLLTSNGGLYIKIGQAIGNNAALLPRPIQDKFAKLFDDAPQIPYKDVEAVFISQFGRPPAGPDGIFEEFEEQAIASASVAQVHRAKIKTPDGDGPWVAVKIQKPDVTKQVEWDLGAYRIVMWLYEHVFFDMPVYFVVDFVSDHLRMELDFEREAMNSMRTADFVASEPRLADRVYIPKVYPEYTTKKVLVAEWIDGVRLSDRAGIYRLMGERDMRRDPDPSVTAEVVSQPPLKNPLKGGVHGIMHTMVELFSAQIFSWGWIHCDPHPGNVIIRPNPAHPQYPQLVLIDHGLYVRASDKFRKQYATLWKGLLTADFGVVKGVASDWGIGTPDLFASATLMRPIKFTDDPELAKQAEEYEKLDQYQRSVITKARLKSFLIDTDKMPKELIFIGRNMRIVQGNNQMFGSPVNRIRITGYWASRSLTRTPDLTLAERLREYAGYFTFLAVTLAIDVAFYTSKIRQWIRQKLGLKSVGFEDELEQTMRGFAKDNLGLELAEDVFDG
ncbi:ABC1 family-domain-containing protein [Abortiporus biennis]|nr:ABC1 family-domain-containing protein [Abortiporus biennis]